jgi:hypothetical protein
VKNLRQFWNSKGQLETQWDSRSELAEYWQKRKSEFDARGQQTIQMLIDFHRKEEAEKKGV